MRKLTARDLLATLIIAAVVVPFIGYSARGSMPFVQDPRGMAGVVIVGGLLAFAVFGRRAFGTGTFETIMVTLGVLTLGVRDRGADRRNRVGAAGPGHGQPSAPVGASLGARRWLRRTRARHQARPGTSAQRGRP